MNRTIALVGNPNCGKTTLFNGLTGGKIKTGNWPGVTVEKREGAMRSGEGSVNIIDLPGIYSFSTHSEDEKIARDFIIDEKPTLILNIVDGTNLEKNLYLTTHLIELKVPVMVIVNMVDLAEKNQIKLDIKGLSRRLGLPVVGLSAVNRAEVDVLKDQIIKNIINPLVSSAEVSYPNEIEEVISSWQDKILSAAGELNLDPRWICIKLLENDNWTIERILERGALKSEDILDSRVNVERVLQDSPEIICADYRYGFIHSITQTIVKRVANRRSMTDKVDKFVLHRILGIPVFLAVMYLVFWSTITVGGAFIDFFDLLTGHILVDGFGVLLESIGTPSWLKVILADGIGGGIQTISTFIPIIFMMFFMLALLEDSGYMARAAFVMDRFMKLLGLPGKAFIPLLVGFGCGVPAIMASRTLENRRDRYMTIFLTPFMSCGARLPVYALFAAAFFPRNSGMVVFAIYLIGIILAVLTGLLLKKTIFKGEEPFFIMELPPYHRPRLKHILIHTWDSLKGFLLKAGKVIVIGIVILSILNNLGTDGSFGNEDSENSVLSVVGRTITPVFEPMGIEEENWPATVGLFTGIIAKEAVVGTLNSLYGQIAAKEALKVEEKDPDEDDYNFWAGIGIAFSSIPAGMGDALGGLSDPLGIGVVSESDRETVAEEIGAETSIFVMMSRYFSKGKHQAFAYMIFILIYFPCIAAYGAVVKETGALFALCNAVYLTVLGWVTATLYYQVTTGHQTIWILAAVSVQGIAVASLFLMRKFDLFNLEGT